MINIDFNSILDLLEAFPDEQSCIDHLEALRWKYGAVSPFDSASKVYKCKGNKYRCKNTGKYFNVKTDTMFDNTKIELQKWFLAIYIVTSHKKGISSLQLSKDIDVTQKTAWFMLQRIRNCFGISDNDQLDNDVEIDETFVGGKNKNRHTDKKVENSQGRSFKDKTPVLGMIELKGKA
jgi:transposase-like protein